NDGILNIDLSASRDNGTISGIAIIPQNKAMPASANLRIAGNPTTAPADEIMEPAAMGDDEFEIKVYPNPATDVVNLSIGKDIGEFAILLHNTNGQLIEHLDPHALLAGDGRYLIPVNHLQEGVYLITIVNKRETVKR